MQKRQISIITAGLLTVIMVFCSCGFAEDQFHPLIDAARQGKLEDVENLLSNGVDVNYRDLLDGMTALMHASVKGHTELVKVLLAKGADINAKDIDGATALTWASLEGHAEVVKVLLANGADTNARHNGWTALMNASSKGHGEVVKNILARGADVNATSKYGWTALKLASIKNHTKMVELLRAHGAKDTGSDMWSIAVGLLIAFALILFFRIAMNRRIKADCMKEDAMPKKPRTVTMAVYMLYVSIGTAIPQIALGLWFLWSEIRMFPGFVPAVITVCTLALAALAALFYMIGTGRNWARIIPLILLLLCAPFSLLTIIEGASRHLACSGAMLYQIVQLEIPIVAVVLLFQRSSSDWFKAMEELRTKDESDVVRISSVT